ncbi:FkbM family methyltransferase [Alphaproteobacteria bacterium]|nr:FkbM family methyltransferase [Alphaproteobacteria bacterium]
MRFFLFFKRMAGKHIQVCDIGSWIGITSFQWLLQGATHVHAFEPVKNSFDRIVYIGCPQITAHNLALSDYEGEAEIHLSSHEVGSTIEPLLTPDKFKYLYSKDITEWVRVTKLDNLKLDIKFDLMKINAEFSEEKIIKGASNLFQKYTPSVLLIEFHTNFSETHDNLKKYYKNFYALDWKDENLMFLNIENSSNCNHYLYSTEPV